MNWETDSEDSFMSCSSNFESAILKTEFLENSLDLHFGSENGSTMTSMTEIGEEEIATSTPIDTAMIPIPDSEQPTATPLPDQPAKEQPYVESPNLRNGSHETTVLPKPVEKEGLLSSSRSERKSDSERDSQRWRGGSGSPPPRGRPDRSRSRSWERRSTTRRSRSKSRRSRSRGRERDRSRAWRNRSPPPRSRYDRDRKMRSWSKSPPPRSRSRSPPSKLRSRYRNRSRSRSHSPYDSLTPTGGTPTHDSNVDETRNSVSLQSVVHSKRRCRDYEEKGFCMRGEMCPFDHGKDPVVLEDVGQVLSSFSTPRLPPQTLEPPVPPMVAPGLGMHHRPPPNLVEYNPDAPSMEPRMWSKQPFRTAAGRGLMQRGGMMRAPLLYPPHHQRELISVPVMEGQENPQYYNTMSNPMKRQCPPEFSNEMESMPPMKQRFDYSRLGPRGRAGNCSLQLKKVPVGLNNIAHLHNHFFKFGKIVNIQVSFEGDPEAALITFTSHAEASAAYKSTEAVLNNRFIKVFWYNPDKDFNIPRGMFHHRFRPPHPSLPPPIPPFQPPPLRPTEIISYLYEFYVHGWMSDNKLKPPPPPPPYPPPPPCPFPPLLRPQNKQENISPLIRPSAKERLGAPVILNATSSVNNQMDQTNEMEKVLISGANITKTVYIPTALDRKQALPLPKRMIVTTYTNTAQVAQNNIKKKQEEKRKEALKLTQHLCKRKYDLIQKLLHHQKQLIEKMEKGNISPEQRTEIISTIEGFQDNIDMIRKDIKTVVAKPINNAVKVSPQLVKRTREETQKQILDAELDLFNQQQEGKDTSELQKRVLELKTKAHNLGLLANNGVLRLSRGGARFRSCRGRGGINPHATVDHRPTKLLVSGFESDDKAEVLEHFKKFGEVADHIWDEATPALVIQFKTRKDAETAMATGRNFQDRLLSVTWFSSVQNMGMRSSRSVILLNDSTMSDLLSEHDDEEEALRINLDQHEDFLLQDEEEEEDEERSWRR